jgi:hypothetical protein
LNGSEAVLNDSLVIEFVERAVPDGAAAVAGLSTALGERLGLYSAMAGAGPLTSVQLADRAGLNEHAVPLLRVRLPRPLHRGGGPAGGLSPHKKDLCS